MSIIHLENISPETGKFGTPRERNKKVVDKRSISEVFFQGLFGDFKGSLHLSGQITTIPQPERSGHFGGLSMVTRCAMIFLSLNALLFNEKSKSSKQMENSGGRVGNPT